MMEHVSHRTFFHVSPSATTTLHASSNTDCATCLTAPQPLPAQRARYLPDYKADTETETRFVSPLTSHHASLPAANVYAYSPLRLRTVRSTTHCQGHTHCQLPFAAHLVLICSQSGHKLNKSNRIKHVSHSALRSCP